MPSGSFEVAPAEHLGVYVHFPFCAARCTYCDFPSVAGSDARIPRYLRALAAEIHRFELDGTPEVDTIYFGGGTPSRMEPAQVAGVLGAIRSRFRVAEGAEISLEGNPESLTQERLDGYREAGVDRVTIGVQSFDPEVLRRIGRPHGPEAAETAVKRARRAGFDNVGVDLIAGLPGEDLERWRETVLRAAALCPEHVSVYLLETDKDTPLSRSVRAGETTIADDDALADAYSATAEALEGAGLALYEISNFACPERESRHNLKYWMDEPYAGFGAGAHSYLDGERRANHRDLDRYLEGIESAGAAVESREPYDAARRAAEALVMGLRLAAGIDVAAIGRRYGLDLRFRHREAWERAEEAGALEWDGTLARLTAWGRLRSSELFAELI